MKTITRRTYTQADLDQLQAYPPILQKIFAARGIDHPDLLAQDLSSLLPFQSLKNIDTAVHAIAAALMNQQKIVIIGDFDADGATSSALAVSCLRHFGAKDVDFLVPNRFAYGYGLSPEIVEVAARDKPQLIITVDNGISCHEGVRAAKARGIDVVITDHHLAGETLPDALAIVNPNQPGCSFPSKNLAGVGVIFYVLLALRRYLITQNYFADRKLATPNMGDYLDLVALGTVADVVPLDKNNRILVHQGLQRIRAGRARPGIAALLEIAKRTPQSLQASDLGFAVGPRLNAAGRLDDMALGIECLLADNLELARQKAMQLDALNQERRLIESDMQAQAMHALQRIRFADDDPPVAICLYEKEWHQGVIGILAGRIKDKMHRPVVAFARGDNELKGSARSIPGVHIRDVLQNIAMRHPDLIDKFGGHAMAAGLTLAEEKLAEFARAFHEEVLQHVNAESLQANIQTDGELSIDDYNAEFVEMLQAAGPWGQRFPEPTFDGLFDLIEQRIVGEKHLKLVLGVPNTSLQLNAIAFNIDIDRWPNYQCRQAKVVYRLDINEYKGFRSVQLMVEDLQTC